MAGPPVSGPVQPVRSKLDNLTFTHKISKYYLFHIGSNYPKHPKKQNPNKSTQSPNSWFMMGCILLCKETPFSQVISSSHQPSALSYLYN